MKQIHVTIMYGFGWMPVKSWHYTHEICPFRVFPRYNTLYHVRVKSIKTSKNWEKVIFQKNHQLKVLDISNFRILNSSFLQDLLYVRLKT